MPSGEIEITAVQSSAAHRTFCDLPFVLNREDSTWIPPLRREERRRWSPRHNASLRWRTVDRYLATAAGRVVGRIAAIVDPAFTDRWAPQTGFFGFFESVDDQAVADALLNQVESALADRGMTHVLGPINLTTHDEVGLLVDAFQSPPSILSPYNPPYYETLIRAHGYQRQTDYHSYDWDPSRSPSTAVRRLVRMAGRSRGNGSALQVRRSDPRRWQQESRALLELYNSSFADVWGFVPMHPDEFRDRAERFRRFYSPELVVFAEVAGEMVGFALALPNINEVLAPLRGRLFPLGWLRLARTISRIRSARVVLLGVRPGFRGRGIAILLAEELAAAGRECNIQDGELSLVQASNDPIRHSIEALGGKPVKTYRLFVRSLSND